MLTDTEIDLLISLHLEGNTETAMPPQEPLSDIIIGLPDVAAQYEQLRVLPAAVNNEEPPALVDDADPDADMYTDTMPDLESFSADSSDGPPDMPPPDPPPAAAPLPTPTIYLTQYEYDTMSTESPVTTLGHIDSSYDYDDEYPDPTAYDAFENDDLPDYYYDNLSMIQELPSFASVPASELALPFLSWYCC